MKKLSALILIFTILFLCGCKGKPSSDSEAVTTSSNPPAISETVTAPQTTAKVFISEWGSDLVPSDFPAPPEGTYGLYIEADTDKSDENYREGRVFLSFVCAENKFYDFTNGLLENGYIGGVKNIVGGTYYSDGYKGYWQNGKNLVRIIYSSLSADKELTVILEILPCADYFPEALTEFFPKFNGYSFRGGVYCAHDASGEHFETEFQNGFAPKWHWDFRFKNGFIGVTLDEFEDYYKTLGYADFSGVVTQDIVDGCNIMMVDVTKVIDGTTYGVYMLFNQTIRTLDIVYTNEPSLIGAEE